MTYEFPQNDTPVSHAYNKEYLNSRLAGFVEWSRRARNLDVSPRAASHRYDRTAKKRFSFLFRTSPTAVRGDVRTDRSRRARGTNSRAR